MMNKPKYIEARYSAFLSWDLEALDIDWDKIKDYSISRGDLEIEYKDGTKQVEENWEDTVDAVWKEIDKAEKLMAKGKVAEKYVKQWSKK